MVKQSPTMHETCIQFLDQEDPLEKEMTTHCSILAWRIPWIEEPGRLSPWCRKESDTTDQLTHNHKGMDYASNAGSWEAAGLPCWFWPINWIIKDLCSFCLSIWQPWGCCILSQTSLMIVICLAMDIRWSVSLSCSLGYNNRETLCKPSNPLLLISYCLQLLHAQSHCLEGYN